MYTQINIYNYGSPRILYKEYFILHMYNIKLKC